MKAKKNEPIKLIKDCIYIDASHRRTILDKWVYYCLGDAEVVVYLLNKLKTDTKFANADLQYWANKLK